MRILLLFLIICFLYGKKKIYLAYMQCEVTFIPHLHALFLQMVCLRLIVQFVPSAPLIFSVDLHIFRPRIQDLPFNIFISLSASFSHFVLLHFPFLFPFLPTLCAFAEVTTAVVRLSCGPGVK